MITEAHKYLLQQEVDKLALFAQDLTGTKWIISIKENRKKEPVDSEDVTFKVKKMCADYYGVEVGKLSEKSRKRAIVTARQVAIYLLRAYTKMYLKQIGIRFGGRDHTTILSAIRKVKDLMDTERDYRLHVENLEARMEDIIGKPQVKIMSVDNVVETIS